jgi:CRISPR-associated protein Csd2
MSLSTKIDFAVIVTVNHANPNGDPLNGNSPRVDYDGYGEISDVCVKRKIRNRLMRENIPIFVQADWGYGHDGCASLKARLESSDFGLGMDVRKELKAKKITDADIVNKVCEKWMDVRSFGSVLTFSKNSSENGHSIGIRGPVTIRPAFSVDPVEVESIQITKSVNSEGDGSEKTSDTMGMKHRVKHAVYVIYGSMNAYLAERTGFSDHDADCIKQIFPSFLEGDEAAARPAGSMEVSKVIWWKHNCKSGQYSSAKVQRSLVVNSDGSYTLNNLPGLIPEEIEGF